MTTLTMPRLDLWEFAGQLARQAIERGQHSKYACPRPFCRGRLLRDGYGDMTCLQCGRPRDRREARISQGHGAPRKVDG